jgi:ABC-type transport system involved in multi-copper enzyme maturation permease subunit
MALFRSEFLKLRTTRTVLWLTLALVALTGLATATAVGVTEALEIADSEWQTDLSGAALSALGFALLFGILVMTGEFRYGTITPTALVTPRRERVLVAKALAAMLGGALLVLLAAVVVYSVGVPWLAARGIPVRLFEREPLERVGLLVVVGALCGAIGVGLGAIIRSQIGTIIGAAVWLFVLEALVGALVDEAGPYLPAAALGAIAFDVEELSRLGALAVSLGYVVAFCGVGAALLVRRDVT